MLFMYVCMYACVCTHLSHDRRRTRIHAHIFIYRYVCIYIYGHIHVYVCVYIYMRMHAWVHIHVETLTYYVFAYTTMHMYLYLDMYLSVHIYTHLAHVAYATTVVLRSLAARPAMGDDTDPEAQVIESHTSVQDGRLSGLQWRIPACSNPVLNKNLTRRTILKPVRTSRRTEAWVVTLL